MKNCLHRKSHTSGRWANAIRFRCCEIKVKKRDLTRRVEGQGREFSMVEGLIAIQEILFSTQQKSIREK